MLKDTPISESKKRRLEERRLEVGKANLASLSKEQRHLYGTRGGKSLWENNRIVAELSIKKAIEASQLAYRKDELPLLPKLRRLFGADLHKEIMGPFAFDFASDKFLIEHTLDGGGHGLRDAITRFAYAEHDPRKKIVYWYKVFREKKAFRTRKTECRSARL